MPRMAIADQSLHKQHKQNGFRHARWSSLLLLHDLWTRECNRECKSNSSAGDKNYSGCSWMTSRFGLHQQSCYIFYESWRTSTACWIRFKVYTKGRDDTDAKKVFVFPLHSPLFMTCHQTPTFVNSYENNWCRTQLKNNVWAALYSEIV